MKTIYMDHAATTAMSKTALEEMLPYFAEEYGNPSAVYSYGQTGKMQLKNAGKELQNVLERLKRRYISHPAEQKVITGRSEVPVGYGKIRENILFQQK